MRKIKKTMSSRSPLQAKAKKQPAGKNQAIEEVTRSVPDITKLILVAKAGGRCEFDGCNEYLFENPITLNQRNFSQVAHIVAFSSDGPRGNLKRPNNIHIIENLMLLCPVCHKEIDDDPAAWTKEVLELHKRRHEERIRYLTSLAPYRKTTVVIVKSKIAGAPVEVPFPDVVAAVAPRYPSNRDFELIDLTVLDDRGSGFCKACIDVIRKRMERIFAGDVHGNAPAHISLFALAPIHVLVFLGTQFSNKVPADLYQRHRDTEDWTWKSEGAPVKYKWGKVKSGDKRDNVALVLSLSGKININDLPKSVDSSFSIYEFTLSQGTPTPNFLRLKEDLVDFKEAYQHCLRSILAEHGQFPILHLFPAVPAPIAVCCGRELLPKPDPVVLVYDRDKVQGGFNPMIEVNKT